MVTSTWESDRVLAYLYAHPELEVALDTETDGLDVHDRRSKVIGFSISFRADDDELVHFYWGVRHTAGKEQNIDAATAKKIRWVLGKQRRPLVFANYQFDILGMLHLGVDLRENPFHDVLTAQNLINENWTVGRRGLDELAVYTLSDGHRKLAEWPWENEFPLKKEKTSGWPNTTPEMMFDYATTDTDLTLLIKEVQVSTPAWRDLPEDIWETKQKAIRVLTEMRRRGIEVDLDLAEQLRDEGEARKTEIKNELGLNPKSNKDMQELLINRLGLPVLKRSEKTNEPSFAKAVMAEYEPMLERMESPVAELIKEYRGWDTACGLLLNPYLSLTSPDGRLRTEYTTHVTTTGRLSSRNPNLQQISKGADPKPWNDRIKKCFVPREGHVLISADYSQLELRLATAYSQEPALLAVFDEGRDIFTEMTETIREQLQKTSPGLAESWTRQKTKTLVYSLQYGAGDGRLMSAFGISKREAQLLKTSFYRAYPRFRLLEERITASVEKTLKARLWAGRYRHFKYKSEGYKAMNSVMQGGAADIVDRVMIHIMENLDNEDCRLLLQVHDALVFEVREDLAEEYAVKIKAAMEDVNGICNPGSAEPLFPVTFAVEVESWDGTVKYAKDPKPEQHEPTEIELAQAEIRRLKNELQCANEELSDLHWGLSEGTLR